MLMQVANTEQGDTLIEVLLALAILSVIMVSSIVLMNRGQASASNSLERSQVQALATHQGSLLQYIRDSYADVVAGGQTPQAGTAAALWETIKSGYTTAPNVNVCAADGSPNNAANSFFLTYNPAPAANPVTLVAYNGASAAAAAQPGSGMWIEAQSVNGGVSHPYVDFFVKACWRPSGTGAHQEVKNVVRLYDPQ
jgi:Tfp pilus assembly protein PilV